MWISRLLSALALLALLLTACGAEPEPAAALCPDATGPLLEPLVFDRDNNLAELGPGGGASRLLTDLPATDFAVSPSWSPDGGTLAFVLVRLNAPPRPGAEVRVLSQTLCGLDALTGKGRPLLQDQRPVDMVDDAIWSPAGDAMLATLLRPDQLPRTVQIDLPEATMHVLADQAQSPTRASDGQLAYIQFHMTKFGITQTLVVEPTAGAAPQPLLRMDQPFRYVSTPRWSPDARALLFTASHQRPEEQWRESEDHGGKGEHPARPTGRQGGGSGTTLWVVDLAERQPRPLVRGGPDLRSDWSPDGRQIVFADGGQGGIFVLDLATGQRTRIAERGGGNGITWRR